MSNGLPSISSSGIEVENVVAVVVEDRTMAVDRVGCPCHAWSSPLFISGHLTSTHLPLGPLAVLRLRLSMIVLFHALSTAALPRLPGCLLSSSSAADAETL